MRDRIPWLVIVAVALLSAPAARAADIAKCAMVADGRAEVFAIPAELDDGRTVTLSGLFLKPPGEGPFPLVLMLPGGGSLVTPYCNEVVAQRFVGWGYAALVVASSTAHDRKGNRLLAYSFTDQANHARGAVRVMAARPDIDGARVAVWGFSRGGLTAVELATRQRDGAGPFRAIIAAAPHCPAHGGAPHMPLLLIIGTADAIVSLEACQDFAAAMQDKSGFEFLLLPGASHVFWLDPAADEASAERMGAFLRKHL